MTPQEQRRQNRPRDPSQEEIVAACEQIRAGWTEGERRRRGAWQESEPWTAPEYDDQEVAEW